MTTTEPLHDPAALAAHARSILSLPRSVSLVVEGSEVQVDEDVSLREDGGVPILFAPADSRLDLAAEACRTVLMRVVSDLEPGSSGTFSSLVIAGTLRHCDQSITDPHTTDSASRDQDVRTVTLDIGLVSVVFHAPDGFERHLSVPAAHFHSPEHRLNRGYLLGCQRHANDCHQDELRQSVALATGTHRSEIAAVLLDDLDPTGVVLRWIDSDGAHEREIAFPRVARCPEELAGLLSAHLQTDLH